MKRECQSCPCFEEANLSFRLFAVTVTATGARPSKSETAAIDALPMTAAVKAVACVAAGFVRPMTECDEVSCEAIASAGDVATEATAPLVQ